ncbi:sulfatase [Altererythrobacter sp. B11]|uniref:sulfatase-like hydrolase/transferase n=1 Tax=Altererythrobacter sp. B11 TaxID=2060312 RepID=UPI000DC6EE5D|nr:sulfatase-like hydrolase/transferase [Altererythrobacter sp. B11]BBC74284.1 sulfatase [Altererythrobacter sp. B11]
MSARNALPLSRRRALCTFAGLAAAGAARAQVPASDAPRPNILWLVSEDNNPFIGCYGDPIAHTPTIDGLAAEGLLYRNVYSNAPVCAPSRFGILTGVYPESCSPAHQMRAEAVLPAEFRTYPELLRAAGWFCTNNAKTDYNCTVDPNTIWDEQGDEAHWKNRPDGQPFMSVFNFMVSHESRIFQPVDGRVTPDMVRLPAYLPDTPDIRRDYATYYNLVEQMDGQVGEKLAELEAAGLAEDTIVFYYSDNGGVLPRSKRYCYDEGLRCAMVVRVPEKWRHWMPAGPGSEIAAPVSLIDLAPTLLSLAGISQPPQMRGHALLGPASPGPQPYAFGMRNRMDERIDFTRTATDGRWRYIRNYMPHRPWGQHGAFEWLAKGYQSWEREHLAGRLNPVQDRFFHTKPYEELYDLESDPDQVNDLAGKAAHADMLAKLSAALDEQMIAIHDNGFLPETMAGEGYAASRDPALYPLRQLMEVGAKAARRDARARDEFAALLDTKVEVLRYWGAMGLLLIGEDAEPAKAALQAALAGDESPHVRIVAAEALARLGEDEAAVPALVSLAGEDLPWQVRLYAINSLTFLGDKARPALGLAQRMAAEEDQEYLRSAGRYLSLQLTGEYTPETPVFDFAHMMKTARRGGGGA